MSWFGRARVVLAVAMVVAIGAFYFVWYRPATSKMHALRARLDQDHQSLEAQRSRADELPTVAKQVESLRQRLAEFDRRIPRHQELPQFLDNLESVKQQAGVTKWTLKPSDPRTTDSYTEQAFHIDFEGEFAQVSDFLARVESMDRMTRVRRLALKAADSTRGTVEVQMDVCIYYLEG
jgi:Tfp pilus assembly protein PilO